MKTNKELKNLEDALKPRKPLDLHQRLDMGEFYIKAIHGCKKSYMDLVSCCHAYNKSGYDTSYFDELVMRDVLPIYKGKR